MWSMDSTEIDRRVLLCICDCLGANENGRFTPNVERIARRDAELPEKVRMLRREIERNYDRNRGLA